MGKSPPNPAVRAGQVPPLCLGAWVALGTPCPIGWRPPASLKSKGGIFPPLSSFTEEREVSFDLLGPSRAGLFSSFLSRGFGGGLKAFGCFVCHPQRVPVPLSPSQLTFLGNCRTWGIFGGFWGNDSPLSLSVVWLRKKDNLNTLSNYFWLLLGELWWQHLILGRCFFPFVAVASPWPFRPWSRELVWKRANLLFSFPPKQMNAETENSQTLLEVVSNNGCIFYEHLVTRAMTLQKSGRDVQIILLYPRAGKRDSRQKTQWCFAWMVTYVKWSRWGMFVWF